MLGYALNISHRIHKRLAVVWIAVMTHYFHSYRYVKAIFCSYLAQFLREIVPGLIPFLNESSLSLASWYRNFGSTGVQLQSWIWVKGHSRWLIPSSKLHESDRELLRLTVLVFRMPRSTIERVWAYDFKRDDGAINFGRSHVLGVLHHFVRSWSSGEVDRSLHFSKRKHKRSTS